MHSHDIVYYSYSSNEPVYYKTDGGIFEYPSNKLVAYVEEKIWYSCKTIEPIAFEEDKVVFDYSSSKPLLYREDAC